MLVAARRGIRVPLPETVAATVKLIWSPSSVTVQVTPVAVPVLEISAAVKDPTLMASEKVIVKLTGTELVEDACPDFLTKLAMVGATLSCVYETMLVHVEALFAMSVI